MYIIYIANRYFFTPSNGVKWMNIITIYYYYSTYVLPMPIPSSNIKCLWTDYKIILTNNILGILNAAESKAYYLI